MPVRQMALCKELGRKDKGPTIPDLTETRKPVKVAVTFTCDADFGRLYPRGAVKTASSRKT